MPRRVTIKDVAREAGVSFKTVSNVLNGTGSFRDSTKQTVMDAVQKLGYVRNPSARTLKTGETKIIGLSIFDFSQPFSSYFTDQVIYYARQFGYSVIVHTYGQGTQRVANISENVRFLPADGWIIFVDEPLTDEGASLVQSIPVVMAGDYDAYGRVDYVTMPNEQACRTAINKLLDVGYRDIALCGTTPGITDFRQYLDAKEGTQELRVKGYLQAFADHNLTPDPRLFVPCQWLSMTEGVEAVGQLLDRGVQPDAIVCLNDAVALGVLHGLQSHGIRVPEDVQVMGFDNVPEGQFSNPSLTTIDPHVREYAMHAVDMLLDRLQGYDGAPRTYTSDFTIVERNSMHIVEQ